MRKYNIGDKVLIVRRCKRTPNDLLENLRLDHHRTITAIYYDSKTQHTRYYLGSNNRGDVDLSGVDFRATQIRSWIRGKNGRPKTKRRYRSPYS